jgi:hypothetical protein
LQLNNTDSTTSNSQSTAGTAIDVSASSDPNQFPEIATVFADLVKRNDGDVGKKHGNRAVLAVHGEKLDEGNSKRRKVFRRVPWDSEAMEHIKIRQGQNLFWVSEIPESFHVHVTTTNGVHESGREDHALVVPVTWNVRGEQDLTWGDFEDLLRHKMDGFIQQMKVLKVVDTKESLEQVKRMKEYFMGLEKYWIHVSRLKGQGAKGEEKRNDEAKVRLKGRLKMIKSAVERRSKSLVQRLLEIANDDKVGKLNSAQQVTYITSWIPNCELAFVNLSFSPFHKAAYLRSVSVSKNSKSLAKRALNSSTSLDFTSTIRSEIQSMHSHLHELSDIDDTHHPVSFFSLETTLAGIKAVCELVDDDLVNDVEVSEVLELLNLVGVGVSHDVGEYPDPMTFRVSKMYAGCFVSLSDILVNNLQTIHADEGRGSGYSHYVIGLTVPGGKDEDVITNVVPVFEGEDGKRILMFLRRHAPRLLELYASVGMRRVLADVNMTFGYTIINGMWRALEELGESKHGAVRVPSEVAVRCILGLVDTMLVVSGTYFDHVMPALDGRVPQPDGMAFNLLNNGITNLLVPLTKFLKPSSEDDDLENETTKKNVSARALRSLYSFEVWQSIRKMYRHVEDSNQVAESMLHKLLNLDIERTRAIPTPLFEDDWADPVQFEEGYELNVDYLNSLQSRFTYLDTLAILEHVLKISQSTEMTTEEKVVHFKQNIPKTDEGSVRVAMGISYELNQFQLYNIFEALVYKTRASRIADTPDGFGMSVLPDLDQSEAGEKMVAEYVKELHRARYKKDLYLKREEEVKILTTELVEKMVWTTCVSEFKQYFRMGIVRNKSWVEIRSTESEGFPLLQNELLDPLVTSGVIPWRLEKLRILLMGRARPTEEYPDGELVWNYGNPIHFTNLNAYAKIWEAEYSNSESVDPSLENWEDMLTLYVAARRHVYRPSGKENRHGHSNEKRSYWALGYQTLEAMKISISSEAWEAYCKSHAGCCGVNGEGTLSLL